MVSGFHPNFADDSGPARAVRDDRMTRSLIHELEQTDDAPKPWGVLSSGVVAFLSFGILPVLLWHDRFRDFVDDERRRLRQFAEWMRLHSGRPETMDLRVAGEDLGSRPLLSTLSILSVVGMAVLFFSHLNGWVGMPVADQVLAGTWRFRDVYAWKPPLTRPQQLYAAWGVGLSVAYLFHWVQVQAHASDVRRFVRYANRIFLDAGVRRIPMPRVGLGVGVLWAAVAFVLASKGAWWGIALALTGAVQQRYMRAESFRVRRVIATRLRELTGVSINGEFQSSFAEAKRRCPHGRCLSPMPLHARFCPRCGHNVQASSATSATGDSV